MHFNIAQNIPAFDKARLHILTFHSVTSILITMKSRPQIWWKKWQKLLVHTEVFIWKHMSPPSSTQCVEKCLECNFHVKLRNNVFILIWRLSPLLINYTRLVMKTSTTWQFPAQLGQIMCHLGFEQGDTAGAHICYTLDLWDKIQTSLANDNIMIKIFEQHNGFLEVWI